MKLIFINKIKKFEKSFLYILKILNKWFVDIPRSILFIKRVINWKIDINNNKKIIILLLNILNNFINFELNIKFDEILRKTRI